MHCRLRLRLTSSMTILAALTVDASTSTPGASSTKATVVSLQDCAVASQWNAPARGKSGTVSLRHGALCLSVSDPVQRRAKLVMGSCSDASEQLFTFPQKDASLEHTKSGLRAGAEHARTTVGSRCDVDKWDKTDNQRWNHNTTSYVIVHELSGLCLSSGNGSTPQPSPSPPPVPLSPSTVNVTLDRMVSVVDEEYAGVAYDTAAWLGIPWEGAGPVTAPDLDDPYLRKVVSHLAPARLRVGGGAGDCQTYLHPPANQTYLSAYCKGRKYYDYGVRAVELDKLVAFANATGLKLVFGLNAQQRQSTAVDGYHRWDSANAAKLLELPSACKVSAYELGNELRNGKLEGEPPTAAQYGHDYQTLAALLYEKCGAEPPMAVGTAQDAMPPSSVDAFLTAANGTVAAFTWHHYPGGTHCSLKQLIDPISLDGTVSIAAGIEPVVRKHSIAQWCAETSGSSGGGTASLTDRYGDGLWWLDQLGSLAQAGVTSQNRQSLLGANYGVLNYTTYRPFPSYFAVILWKRLMGQRVLDAAASTASVSVRAYVHCHPALDGSVTAVLINIAEREVSVLFPAALNASETVRYMLTATGTSAAEVALNDGGTLSLDASGALPEMEGRQAGSGEPLTVAALSYGFVHFVHADAHSCRFS